MKDFLVCFFAGIFYYVIKSLIKRKFYKTRWKDVLFFRDDQQNIYYIKKRKGQRNINFILMAYVFQKNYFLCCLNKIVFYR